MRNISTKKRPAVLDAILKLYKYNYKSCEGTGDIRRPNLKQIQEDVLATIHNMCETVQYIDIAQVSNY